MIVLVVDDSSVMRKIHERALVALGWSVTLAEDGVDACAKLAAMPHCDLVLTDLHMPNMDGLQLIEQVRKKSKFPVVKILMVTSDGVLEAVEKAVNAGADDVLIKPFTPAVFAEKIRGLGI